MKKIIFGCITFLVLSCAQKESAEVKSPLELLNGEHYDSSNVIGMGSLVIPTGQVKERATLLQGFVYRRINDLEQPIAQVRLGVFSKDEKALGETTSQMDGSFSMKVPLKNGSYFLRPITKKLTGSLSLRVDSYEIKDLNLVVTDQ